MKLAQVPIAGEPIVSWSKTVNLGDYPEDKRLTLSVCCEDFCRHVDAGAKAESEMTDLFTAYVVGTVIASLAAPVSFGATLVAFSLLSGLALLKMEMCGACDDEERKEAAETSHEIESLIENSSGNDTAAVDYSFGSSAICRGTSVCS